MQTLQQLEIGWVGVIVDRGYVGHRGVIMYKWNFKIESLTIYINRCVDILCKIDMFHLTNFRHWARMTSIGKGMLNC